MVNTDTQEIVNDYDKVQSMGYSSFVYALMINPFLGMAIYNIFKIAKVDTWVSALVGGIIGIIPLLLILYIIKHSNGDNILDLNIRIFGKVFGNIMNVLINISVILFVSLILYNLSLFLNTQYIPDTSSLYIKILIIIPVIYGASKSISTLSRVSQIVLIINVILFLISLFGIAGDVNFNNLLPVMSDGILNPIVGAIQYVIFGVLPLFFLTIIPTKLVPNSEKITKKVSIMYIVVNVILFIIFFVTTAILGYEIISIYKYPEYMVLKRFSLFEIVERVENTLAIQFVFSMFVSITFGASFINTSLKRVFKKVKSQQLFAYIVGIALIIISTVMFKNSDMATQFILNVAPYIIGITLSFFIITTFIGVFVKEKRCISKSNN